MSLPNLSSDGSAPNMQQTTQPPPPSQNSQNSQSSQNQQQQQQQQPQLRGNIAPSQSGQNGPQGAPRMSQNGRKKIYQIRNATFEVDPQYDVIKAIGIGAYGLVCSAQDTTSKQYVAIKKMPKLFDDLVDGRRVLRELRILRWLGKHPHILDLIGVSCPRDTSEQERNSFREVYIVTELLDADLSQLLRSRQRLSIDHHAYVSYQILTAIAYIHSAGVIHRDLKPSNILVNANCEIRVCDFGLSRANVPTNATTYYTDSQSGAMLPGQQNNNNQGPQLSAAADGSSNTTQQNQNQQQFIDSTPETQEMLVANAQTKKYAPFPSDGSSNNGMGGSPGLTPMQFDLTEYVVTRWYRPPELLLGVGYNHSVDLWSIGCILMEVVTRRPLFDGRNYMEQLEKIAEIVPMPDKQDVPSMLQRTRNQEPAKCIESLRKAHETSQFASKLPNGNDELETVMEEAKYPPIVRRLMRYLKLPIDHAKPDMPMSKAVDLISQLLSFHLSHRPTAEQALHHPFLSKHVNESTFPSKTQFKKEQAEECLRMYKSSAPGVAGVGAYDAFHANYEPNISSSSSPQSSQSSSNSSAYNMWAFDHTIRISERELRSEFWVDMNLQSSS